MNTPAKALNSEALERVTTIWAMGDTQPWHPDRGSVRLVASLLVFTVDSGAQVIYMDPYAVTTMAVNPDHG